MAIKISRTRASPSDPGWFHAQDTFFCSRRVMTYRSAGDTVSIFNSPTKRVAIYWIYHVYYGHVDRTSKHCISDAVFNGVVSEVLIYQMINDAFLVSCLITTCRNDRLFRHSITHSGKSIKQPSAQNTYNVDDRDDWWMIKVLIAIRETDRNLPRKWFRKKWKL